MEQNPTCGKCKKLYNLDNRKPTIFACGHTCCYKCFSAGIQPQENMVLCPYDQKLLKKFEVDFFNESILDEIRKKEFPPIICSAHPDLLAQFVCEMDKELICIQCIPEHQTHELKSIGSLNLQNMKGATIEVIQSIKLELDKDIVMLNEFFSQNEKLESNQVSHDFAKMVNLLQFMESNYELERKPVLDKLSNFIYSEIGLGSILNRSMQIKLWKKFQKLGYTKKEVIYSGARDGWTCKIFHEKCDNQGPTLAVIKTNNNKVIGGYTKVSWRVFEERPQLDDNSFIFNQEDNETYPIRFEAGRAIHSTNSVLLQFGDVAIKLVEKPNANTCKYDFAQSFEVPVEKHIKADFKVTEMEVIKLS